MIRLIMMSVRNIHRVPTSLYKLRKYSRNPERYLLQERYNHVRYIFHRGIVAGRVKIQTYGTENIPGEDGFVMYANHQGLFDIMAITETFERPWSAVMKKEVCGYPFMQDISNATDCYPMDRNDMRDQVKVIQNVTEQLKRGRNYLIFPEGTRGRNKNQMLEFHKGSFKCALKAKCPILPIAVIDCYKILDQKGYRKETVQIHYLPVIQYEEYKDMNTTELSRYVWNLIHDTVKRYADDE